MCFSRLKNIKSLIFEISGTLIVKKVLDSVAGLHHFYAAPTAPAPTLPYSKKKFLKQTKVYIHVETTSFI
jgi:hypothetical protein